MASKEEAQRELLIQTPGRQEGEGEERGIRIRTSKPLQDFGQTDTRRHGVGTFELVGGMNRYARKASRKELAAIEAGQYQMIFDNMVERVCVSAATDQVLTYLLGQIPAADFNNPKEVAVATGTVKDYMQLRGVKDYNTAKEALAQELETLRTTHFRQVDDANDFIGVPMLGGPWGIVRGKIIFTFSPAFKEGFLLNSGAFYQELDPAAWRVNNKNNPHAWHIYKKLLNNWGTNVGSEQEYLLSVKSLLEAVPTLPTAEEVANGPDRGHETERIIAPLERDLNHLVELGVLEDWRYCHSKGKPLSAEEAALDGPMPWAKAKGLLITWGFTHEYDRDHRLENRDKHAQHMLEEKKAAAKASRKGKAKS